MTDAQKLALAIYDNRSSDLSVFDVETLKVLADDGLNLNKWWFKDELPKGLIEDVDIPPKGKGGKGPADPTERDFSIELKFDADEFEAFKEMAGKLAKKFKTESVQDTVVASMRELTRDTGK